ncbi:MULTISPECIES: ArsR/SmtB family transcription factor [Vibrio]|uniref:Putative ArsR family transcriptional regulator n=1 Tax=Vibrio proteolyticus NBRC 13287 TaxID=1219065 RepID=U3A114_VIBPR|nr:MULTISPECIES: metalloregulator ArsR/SmtB family transcription factor [Vibrio]NAW56415.1 metalloregulator ArsR/SmtB family transcription factor [Vibrio sp. V36_P2S2PM302]NAX20532.1 metalloregulator ArsR/SmtB family transcription factor [Vibrio sp. V39_P1S14PM300]NAX28111.1 metalloregulator ArsR/SmtB family transcription factor [Vibrio sp. V38_P2S17PM301]NAX32206.1 metalloregulator ArsR/SmtB family transcription factor [Vibrio sp. V37_P2S8PM304]GAD67370.1 putative ArsR family transcriptional 
MDTANIDQMKSNVEEVAELLKIMAHPERLMVLCQLTQGEVGAGQLQKNSSLSQSAFSQHLTVLRKHQMIQARKESQQVFYSLADPRISHLITSLHSVFCQ